MKKSAVFVIIVVSALAAYSVVEGAEWRHFSTDLDYNMFFYDVRSVSYPSKSVVRVWTEVRFSEKGRDHYIRDRIKQKRPTKGYGKLKYSKSLFEINCATMEERLIVVYDYDSGENVIGMEDYGNTLTFLPIPPDSITEELFRPVCAKKPPSPPKKKTQYE